MMTDPGLPLTTGEGNTAEVCADCGIPLVWCRRVTSNPAHCWRWDYERFDDMATECGRLREQLDAARRELTDYQRVVWVAVWNAPGHRLEVFPTMHRDSDMTLIREPLIDHDGFVVRAALGVEGPAE